MPETVARREAKTGRGARAKLHYELDRKGRSSRSSGRTRERKTLTREKKAKKIEYKTVSLPSRLADDIQELMDEFGYWPSLGAFVREAALEKMRRERQSPGKIVEEPIMAINREERER